ncbi:HPP family protein [Sulfolobus sp. E5]|nr:HPP family protein [Sulfolobus sp. E5]
MEAGNAKKIVSVLNLIISISLLVLITIITRTEFILPPFIATASTKYADPDWKMNRNLTVLSSYLLCSVIAVLFSLFNLSSIVYATLASFLSFLVEVVLNIEHPPSLLVTFLGVLEKVKLFYILHPILTGVIVIEGVNYLLVRYLEPKLKGI